jgi:hypothetical protein
MTEQNYITGFIVAQRPARPAERRRGDDQERAGAVALIREIGR